MNQFLNLKDRLKEEAALSRTNTGIYYKTGPGDYAEHERFLGISNPVLRKIAKQFEHLCFDDLKKLIASSYNEERLLSLFILVNQFNKGRSEQQAVIYQFYFEHLQHINNWNLVDASAYYIPGAYLYQREKDILLKLVQSDNLWHRRIAIVSTLYFIRNHDLSWTFKLADYLIDDPEDLLHKATGWMLREAGKRNEDQLMQYLEQNANRMPRTMLRYAIEKLSDTKRRHFLKK